MAEFSVLSDIPAAAWAATAAGFSSVLTWWLGMRGLRNAAVQNQRKMVEEYTLAEQTDRAQFRSTLMSDLASMRALQHECEIDRAHLRGRINANERQILVLKASAEIMQKWLTFFKNAETTMPGALNAMIASLPSPSTIDPEWSP